MRSWLVVAGVWLVGAAPAAAESAPGASAAVAPAAACNTSLVLEASAWVGATGNPLAVAVALRSSIGLSVGRCRRDGRPGREVRLGGLVQFAGSGLGFGGEGEVNWPVAGGASRLGPHAAIVIVEGGWSSSAGVRWRSRDTAINMLGVDLTFERVEVDGSAKPSAAVMFGIGVDGRRGLVVVAVEALATLIAAAFLSGHSHIT